MKAKMKACRFVFVASCLCAATAHAADLYYDLDPATAGIDGGAGNWADSNWKTTPDGTSGLTWSANDSAFFNPIIGVPGTTTVTLAGTQTATAVMFNGAGYTLTGGTLSLAGTGAANWITMNADGVIASALGHMRFRGAGEATISGGGAITGRGILGDGGGNLVTVRQTAGTVTINDYFMVGGNNVAGSQGHYVMDGGSLTISQGIYLGWGHSTSSGTFTQNGGTVTTLAGDQGIQLGIGGGKGYYHLNGGTLVSNFGRYGAPYSGAFSFGGGTFRAATSFDTNRQTGVTTTIADGATARIDTNGQTVTWSSALTGAAAAGLVKSGDGLLVLSGDNAYAGNTEAARGTIRAGHANAFGNATGTVIASGVTSSSGAIDLNGFSFDNPFEIRDRAAGPGAAGALQNTNTNQTAVLNGTLAIGGEHYLGGNGSVTLNGVVSGGTNTIYAFYKQGSGTWSFQHEENTFDGFYYQIGGTTEVTRLANLNEDSSLGRPTTANANRFSFGFNGGGGGTLRFIGDAPSTSDRVFVLFGATGGSSNTIEAAGANVAATLTLTGGLSAIRSGAYQLVLGGDHAGDNEFAGDIINGSGTVAVAKQGAGRWILGGNNTYTGATTVSAGTLLITGALGNSPVTVEDGAIIGGSGTIGGALTFAAGGRLDLTGATLGPASANILSVASGQDITLTDFSFADIIGWDWSNAAVGTYTLINGGGAVILAGATPTAANPFDFGNGKSGYFQQGSFQAVIIPEPAAALLAPLALLALLRRRRETLHPHADS
ncbi:MAG: autotransporter-associated beta strand repeat-containing protein [Akkermansiaceae bacterium]|nr:autotransporter-associated beta strand repeat-containing protein [Akkermansiaceae bacterium]